MAVIPMSDKYIEKNFLWLVLVSVLLHAALLTAVIYFPEETKPFVQKPYVVELKDLPPIPAPPEKKEHVSKQQSQPRPKAQIGFSNKGVFTHREASTLPTPSARQEVPPPQKEGVTPQLPSEKGNVPVSENSRAGDFFRKKEHGIPGLNKLFPSARKTAKLEEEYREKYNQEVADGEAAFLNTDDLRFGSFMRRLESAIYGVWRYPEEAARLGIEGVTPVRITFNRQGEIEKVEILQSSGSKILDDEVKRTLKMIGPVGGFPRGYDKDTFKLIAFFHYSIVRGMMQGTLN